MSFKGLATNLFGNLVDRNQNLFLFVKGSLPKADMRIPFRTYVSTVFLTCVIAYTLSLVMLMIVFQMLRFSASIPLLVAYYIFIPIINTVVVFSVLIFYPMQRMQSRRKGIEMNLPFVLTHMGAIAESGVPPYVIFKLIGECKEYGELSKEMQKITRNIDEFGIDPLTAVKEVAERTPSDDFRQILLGFVSTTESGGNVKLYLKNAGQQALFEWRIKREKFLQQLSAYAEFYTGLLIAAPLFIIALFAVMNMIQPEIAGYNILFLTQASIYGIVPLVNGGFLAFLKGVEVEM